jgi:hypothetical protein
MGILLDCARCVYNITTTTGDAFLGTMVGYVHFQASKILYDYIQEIRQLTNARSNAPEICSRQSSNSVVVGQSNNDLDIGEVKRLWQL